MTVNINRKRFIIDIKMSIYLLFMNAKESTLIYWQTLPDLVENYCFDANTLILDIEMKRDFFIMKSLT